MILYYLPLIVYILSENNILPNILIVKHFIKIYEFVIHSYKKFLLLFILSAALSAAPPCCTQSHSAPFAHGSRACWPLPVFRHTTRPASGTRLPWEQRGSLPVASIQVCWVVTRSAWPSVSTQRPRPAPPPQHTLLSVSWQHPTFF